MTEDRTVANPASEPGLSRDQVERAEARRQAAMLAENVPSLSELLADDLVWIHGSSKRDTKASFLCGFASGRFRCFRLAHAEVSIRTFGPAALVAGTLEMDVSVDGERRTVNNLYGALWVRHPDGPKLVHWQSTRA